MEKFRRPRLADRLRKTTLFFGRRCSCLRFFIDGGEIEFEKQQKGAVCCLDIRTSGIFSQAISGVAGAAGRSGARGGRRQYGRAAGRFAVYPGLVREKHVLAAQFRRSDTAAPRSARGEVRHDQRAYLARGVLHPACGDDLRKAEANRDEYRARLPVRPRYTAAETRNSACGGAHDRASDRLAADHEPSG